LGHEQEVADEIRSMPPWLTKWVKIVSAVAVGTLIAAPLAALAALAVSESVAAEMIKAGIVLAITL
jgi:hypothetical protein